MKTALILFKDADEKFDANYLQSVTDVFADAGFAVTTVEVLPCDDEVTFTRSFKR